MEVKTHIHYQKVVSSFAVLRMTHFFLINYLYNQIA